MAISSSGLVLRIQKYSCSNLAYIMAGTEGLVQIDM